MILEAITYRFLMALYRLRIENFDAVQRGIEVLFDLRALSLVKCAVELGPLFVFFVSRPFILLLLLMSLKRYKVIEDQ